MVSHEPPAACGYQDTLTRIARRETLPSFNPLIKMPRGATTPSPIFLLSPTDAYARRGGGVAYAWRSEGGLWRANEPCVRCQGPLPDSTSHATRDYSSVEAALQRSALMMTDDWPARYVKTLAQALHHHAHVASHWDWRVVARAVGVVEAAVIAAVAWDGDFEGSGARIRPRERFAQQVRLRPHQLVALLARVEPEARAFGLALAAQVH